MSMNSVSRVITAAPPTVNPERLRPCPVCDSTSLADAIGPIKRCVECSLAFVNPLDEFRGEHETEEYFLNDYLPLHLSSRETSLAERRAHIRAIASRYRLPKHPRHLDIGCALGFMLEQAQAAGWQSTGVETSEFAARYAAQHTSCEVFAGTLQDANFPNESFDVVTLMDVIEHVPQPRALVAEIFRVLQPGGILYVVTPNFDSFFVRIYKDRAYGVWPEQHVVYFSAKSIKTLFRTVGFRDVAVATKDFYASNLQRLLGRKDEAMPAMKAAFGGNPRLSAARRVANKVLSQIHLGDKLVAFGKK